MTFVFFYVLTVVVRALLAVLKTTRINQYPRMWKCRKLFLNTAGVGEHGAGVLVVVVVVVVVFVAVAVRCLLY